MANADIFSAQMANQKQELARRSAWVIKFAGVDCTQEVMRDLLSVDITDNESETADDLQIKLADNDGKWIQRWLTETIFAGAKLRGLTIEVWVGTLQGDRVVQQKAGTFSLDSVKAGGPPSTVTIKASSLPYTGGIRNERRDRAWEGTTLAGIAGEFAGKAGLSLVYDASPVFFDRREQNNLTDMAFLRSLCNESGLALKVYDRQMILFDAQSYAGKPSVMTIRYNDGSYTKWNVEVNTSDTSYDSCVVRYAHPENGLIEGGAISPKYAGNSDHNQLVISNRRVESAGEAQAIAMNELRLKNDFGETATFTLPGNPMLMAGQNVTLIGFGYWSGKHPVKQVRHRLGASGYTTEIKLGGDSSNRNSNEDEDTLGNKQMIRIGTVMAVNEDKTKARVKFTGQKITSDWLYVIQFPEWGPTPKKKYTEYASHKHHIASKWSAIKDSQGGALQGDETDSDGSHRHEVRFIQWFPRVNDKVVCLFPPGSDSHGYIVGCI